jgi:hypothetical protein
MMTGKFVMQGDKASWWSIETLPEYMTFFKAQSGRTRKAFSNLV